MSYEAEISAIRLEIIKNMEMIPEGKDGFELDDNDLMLFNYLGSLNINKLIGDGFLHIGQDPITGVILPWDD